jgi:hypothetical protein
MYVIIYFDRTDMLGDEILRCAIRLYYRQWIKSFTMFCKNCSLEIIQYFYNKYEKYLNTIDIFHAVCSSGKLILVKWVYFKRHKINVISVFYNSLTEKYTPPIKAWLDTIYAQYYLPLI